ncbi:acyl carrier protein [Streptomyces sp. NPDC006516]|uniref:acyl carrier protein n=1 Tax=Streptomyces sp. NPDC006516 TaxID=3154309 RepID=UPI0033AE2B00
MPTPPTPGPPPTAEQVSESVRTLLAEVLQRPSTEVDMTQRLTALPGMDSLHLVQTVVTCERQWNIQLDEEELFDVRTGDDLCALIRRTANAQEGTL